MFQTLVNIFAVFGAGCFIAGVGVTLAVTWAYLELQKEDEQERRPVQPAPDWQKRIEEEFSLDPRP